MPTLHLPENHCSISHARRRFLALLGTAAMGIALAHAAPPRRAPTPPAPKAATAPEPAVRPELDLQVAHNGPVWAVAFLPDGKTLASVGGDQIKLWDVATGVVQRTLRGHRGMIAALAVSPDGTMLASGGADGLRFWDARTGVQREMRPQHQVSVGCVTFSPDGTTIASSGGDGITRLWDARTGGLLHTLEPRGALDAVVFAPDGQTVAVANLSGNVQRWDVATGRLEETVPLAGYPGGNLRLVFSPDGKTVASRAIAATDSEIRLWDARTGVLQQTLTGHTDGVSSVAFSPDGELLAGGGGDGSVRLWDAHTGVPRTLQYGDGGDDVLCIAFSLDSQTLATGSSHMRISLWGLRERLLSRATRGFAAALSPDGRLLASFGEDMTLRLWDLQKGTLQRILTAQKEAWPAAFSPDGKMLASTGNDAIQLWDVQTGAELRILTRHTGMRSVAFTPDGKTLASGGPSEVTLWDVQTGHVQRTLAGHTEPVFGVAFSPDGQTLASASWDNTVRMWNARTGDLLRTLTGHSGHVWSVAFSPDDRHLVSGADGEWKLWDARTGKLLRTSSTVGSAHLAIMFSSDGKTLVTGQNDGVTVWDVETGAVRRTLSGHYHWVNAAYFSPDGKRIISGSVDQTIRIWDASSGRLLAALMTLLPPTPQDRFAAEWLTVTPEGYYDASPGAGRFIRWQVGPDLFPVEAYEQSFHRPDLLRKTLAGEPITEHPEIRRRFAAGRAIPPQVIITRPRDRQTVSGDTLHVDLTVTDDHRVVRVEVRVNGRPVNVDIHVGPPKPIEMGGKPIELGGRPIELGGRPIPAAHRFVQQLTAEVPLPVGEKQVTLKAIAYDDDGLKSWADLHLIHKLSASAGTRPAARGDLYVLAIGVSQYRNPQYNLQYAAADAQAFAGLWKRMEGTLYRRVIVTPLTDSHATAANIRSELFELVQSAHRQDSVAVFLSGHGVQGGDGQFYFATHEIDAAPGRVAKTALPWTVFPTMLAKVDAQRVFLFLDACHSGSALGERQASNERLAEALVHRGGVLVFTSSRGGEVSYEAPALQHGAFTAALLEGIGDGQADVPIRGRRDGNITAAKLLTYLQTRVPELTGNRQTPACPLIYDFGETFLLARTR